MTCAWHPTPPHQNTPSPPRKLHEPYHTPPHPTPPLPHHASYMNVITPHPTPPLPHQASYMNVITPHPTPPHPTPSPPRKLHERYHTPPHPTPSPPRKLHERYHTPPHPTPPLPPHASYMNVITPHPTPPHPFPTTQVTWTLSHPTPPHPFPPTQVTWTLSRPTPPHPTPPHPFPPSGNPLPLGYIYIYAVWTNKQLMNFTSRTVLYWETLPWNKVKTCIRIKTMLSSPLVIGKRGMSHILIVGIGWHRYCMVLLGWSRLHKTGFADCRAFGGGNATARLRAWWAFQPMTQKDVARMFSGLTS